MRVLALRALGLGDLLTGIPALRAAARAWPRAQLVLAAPAPLGEWLASLGVVDAVLPARGLEPLRWSGPPPDVALNLHGCGPRSHRLLQELRPGRLVGYAAPPAGHDDGPSWDAAEHEVDRWMRLLRWAGGACEPADLRLPAPTARRDHVVLHPGAAAPSRRWPADRWAQVAAALCAAGHPVLVTGVADEAARCDAVAAGHPGTQNRCGADDVGSLAELVATAALLVCGDTGVAHLATAYGTPSVLLFGPTAPERWGPRVDTERHRVLWKPREGDPPGDPHGADLDVRLERITVPEVLGAVEGLLRSSDAAPSSPPGRLGAPDRRRDRPRNPGASREPVVFLRDAGPEDAHVLTDALLEAANWDGQARVPRELLSADPHLAHYVTGWPRAGDFGTVATDGTGAALGAAWCRLFDASDPGYGWVRAGVPELAIGVDPGHRGQGVGTALLQAVLTRAAERGHPGVSLSVEDGNPARTLYERAGFAVVGRNAGSDVLLWVLDR